MSTAPRVKTSRDAERNAAERAAFREVDFQPPVLIAAQVARLIERLRHARAALAARPRAEVVAVLDRVVAAWLDRPERLRFAAERVARSTGYAPAMVHTSLARTLAAWRGGPLRALLDGLVGSHDAGSRADGVGEATPEERSVATPPELVVALLPGNTPGLAIAPTFTALGLGSAIVVKSAHGEPSFAPLLAASISEVDVEIGAACSVLSWSGGTAAIEEPLFAAADRVVVYGRTSTIEAVRRRAGERVIAFGPRVSVAVVAGPGEGFPGDQARALAREIAFLDQRGCLSPQALLVDRRVDLHALGAALATELAAVELEWPRRRLSFEAATAFRRAVDTVEARVVAGKSLALHGGGQEPWAVVVESESELLPTPLDRFVRLQPFDGVEGLVSVLRPLAGVLECVGIDAPPDLARSLAHAARRAGASRVCPVGAMQDPPADWHSGGRPPVLAYLTWSAADEGGEQPARPAPGEAEGTPLAQNAHPIGPSPRETEPRPVADAAHAVDTAGVATHLASAAQRAAELRERFLRHLAQTSDAPRAIVVDRASGSRIWDLEGREYLDLLAGIGVASIGHAHPDVARAVAEQAQRYTHVMVYGEDVCAPQVELAERLAALLPDSLSSVYLTNSGTEAIEGALKLTRKSTGRSRVIAFDGAFHGDTTGALALGGNAVYRKPFRPLLADVTHLRWNHPQSFHQIDDKVAAVFIEPIQAEGGVRIPPPEFLPALAERCRKVGALLVFDEVVTGLGRTGRWFAFEHWPDAIPDVLVLAKSLGGGLPLGAFVASRERMRSLATDPPLGHVTTFGGNPVACAAALAALDVLEREGLVERARRVGSVLAERLAELVGTGELAQVRGIGLLIGLEFQTTAAASRFVDRCREGGVLVGWTLHRDRVIRLAPPLVIARPEIERALEVMRRALEG